MDLVKINFETFEKSIQEHAIKLSSRMIVNTIQTSRKTPF
jgi:hypothetical protein